VLHLAFAEPPGDCHVKAAAVAGDEVFVVKLATGFYRNPELNLPSSNGFMAVLSARTGELLALLHDQGHLTDQRTAMAGAIAARAILREGSRTLGILGAGTQARLQAKLLKRRLGLDSVLIWARNSKRASGLASEVRGEAVSLEDLCARADLIVTTTPSTEPLLASVMIRPGTRIVAVGADSPGKRELDPRILARGRVVVDSIAQCVDHGEAGWAVRAGLIDPTGLIELGTLLETPVAFAPEEIVVADLTGVAIQDFEIAKSVWRRLPKR
jgi:ornithine cyclodeaminase